MRPFVLNGDVWRPVPVDRDDPRLVDRTGLPRLATTDPETMCVYVSNRLRGRDLEVVMTHEVGHCAMHSYGLADSLHRLIPEDTWVDVEEWVCNYLADHGREIMHAANTALGVKVPIMKGNAYGRPVHRRGRDRRPRSRA